MVWGKVLEQEKPFQNLGVKGSSFQTKIKQLVAKRPTFVPVDRLKLLLGNGLPLGETLVEV